MWNIILHTTSEYQIWILIENQSDLHSSYFFFLNNEVIEINFNILIWNVDVLINLTVDIMLNGLIYIFLFRWVISVQKHIEAIFAALAKYCLLYKFILKFAFFEYYKIDCIIERDQQLIFISCTTVMWNNLKWFLYAQ